LIYDALLRFADIPCSANPSNPADFFNIPTWYEYLRFTCDANGKHIPLVVSINAVWLIVAALINILLRIAAVVAIGFVIYGGVQYITSRGNPEKAAQARTTIISALIGLVLSTAAAALVTYIAHQF